MVVGTRVPVRVGRCQANKAQPDKGCVFLSFKKENRACMASFLWKKGTIDREWCPYVVVFRKRGNDRQRKVPVQGRFYGKRER